MKKCELCNHPARMFCDSDQASLCWNCDAKVHCANFLVARHSRNLLCHVCQFPTPWKASGSMLGRTISVCDKCSNNNCNGRDEGSEVNQESEAENDEDDGIAGELNDDGEDDSGDNGDLDSDDDDDDDEDESRENQVVPWSSTSPPPVESSSSGDESSISGQKRGFAELTMPLPLKRMRESADLGFHEGLGCSSSNRNEHSPVTATEATVRVSDDEEPSSRGSFRPSKSLKRNSTISPVEQPGGAASTAAVVCSLQYDGLLSGKDSTATILGICELGKHPANQS